MPLYTWRDKKTDYVVDILRSIEEYDQSPLDEDLPEAERGKDREWVKEIGNNITVQRSAGWGRKGYW